MPIKLQIATPEDAADLVSLHAAVNQRLTSQYGKGPWSVGLTERGVLFAMRISKVLVARRRNRMVATLALSTRKPWAIDKKYFSASRLPLYLTSMAVSPEWQRMGIGRQCVKEACRIAREWPADAIRLDAFAVEGGAGEFYGRCGFREVGRATYRAAPLVYFEMLL